jgi:Tat protein secretion system quality control protein TatD with DNase activity
MPNKYPDFRVHFCELSLSDMILESDTPYLHPNDYPEASPMLLKGNAPRIVRLV